MINIPHLMVFIEVHGLTNELTISDYARRAFASHKLLMTDEEADGFYNQFRCVTLPLVDHDAALSSLPIDVVSNLKSKERCLLAQMSVLEDIPSGERLIRNYCTVLAESFNVCPAGTVVVVRQTDVATAAFICPHLRVDPNTGVLSDARNPLDGRPHTVSSAHSVSHHLGAAAREMDVGQWVETALNTANVLSMALPPPFGFVVPGLLTFLSGGLQGVFGDEGADPFGDLYEKLNRDKVGEWMTDARSLVEHINRQTDIMARNPPTPEQVITDLQWYPSLEKFIAPGHSTLYTALFDFQNLDKFIENKNEFFGLMTCVSIYLFGVKWGLYLKAYAASEYGKLGDAAKYHEYNEQWRSDYVGFVEDILGGQRYEGWVSRVNKLIDERTTYRLSKISDVTRYDYAGLSGPSQGHGISMRREVHQYQWQDGADRHDYPDETPSNAPVVQYHDQAVRERELHYAAVVQQQKDLYADTRRLTTIWTDSINQWNSHLAPGRPATPPSIDPNSLQHPVVAGSVWAEHQNQYVAYAVAYYNRPEQADELNKPKTALISRWSEPAKVNGGSPLLVNVPIDDLYMAIGRHVYRKFILADGGTAFQPVLVGQIPDNTTTTYRDAH